MQPVSKSQVPKVVTTGPAAPVTSNRSSIIANSPQIAVANIAQQVKAQHPPPDKPAHAAPKKYDSPQSAGHRPPCHPGQHVHRAGTNASSNHTSERVHSSPAAKGRRMPLNNAHELSKASVTASSSPAVNDNSKSTPGLAEGSGHSETLAGKAAATSRSHASSTRSITPLGGQIPTTASVSSHRGYVTKRPNDKWVSFGIVLKSDGDKIDAPTKQAQVYYSGQLRYLGLFETKAECLAGVENARQVANGPLARAAKSEEQIVELMRASANKGKTVKRSKKTSSEAEGVSVGPNSAIVNTGQQQDEVDKVNDVGCNAAAETNQIAIVRGAGETHANGTYRPVPGRANAFAKRTDNAATAVTSSKEHHYVLSTDPDGVWYISSWAGPVTDFAHTREHTTDGRLCYKYRARSVARHDWINCGDATSYPAPTSVGIRDVLMATTTEEEQQSENATRGRQHRQSLEPTKKVSAMSSADDTRKDERYERRSVSCEFAE